MVGFCTTLCMTASNPDLSPSIQFSKPDKPDLTKPGLARNLAKPNPGKPVRIFQKCVPVKPGPQTNQTRLDPNQPGGTLIYIYIYMCIYLCICIYIHCICIYICIYTCIYIYIYVDETLIALNQRPGVERTNWPRGGA